MASWSENTKRQYNSSLKAWHLFSRSEKINLVPSELSLCNFLAHLQGKGLSYSTIASHRASVGGFFDNFTKGNLSSSNIVTRFMKGLFRRNPPKPKYSSTWEVAKVLDYITTLGPNATLSLRDLTLKLVFLLAICSPRRVSEIRAFSLDSLQRESDRWTFFLNYRNKNRSSGPAHRAQYESFLSNPILCPVQCLVDYIRATADNRTSQSLLLSYKTFKPVTTATIGRWVKLVLQLAGIEGHFSAHSTRSASTSSAFKAGASLSDILQAACWSKKGSTFEKFYHKDIVPPTTFQSHVLSR